MENQGRIVFLITHWSRFCSFETKCLDQKKEFVFSSLPHSVWFYDLFGVCKKVSCIYFSLKQVFMYDHKNFHTSCLQSQLGSTTWEVPVVTGHIFPVTPNSSSVHAQENKLSSEKWKFTLIKRIFSPPRYLPWESLSHRTCLGICREDLLNPASPEMKSWQVHSP